MTNRPNGDNSGSRIEWTKPAGNGSGKLIAIAAGVVAVVLIVAVVAAFAFGESSPGDESTDATDSAAESPAEFPRNGVFLMTHSETGMCATTGPEPGNDERTVMVLGGCEDTYPTLGFIQSGDESYVVTMDFTEDDWEACLAVDDPADEPGYLLSGQDCESGSDLQTFTLVDRSDGLFAIEVSSGMCVEPLDAGTEIGTALATAECADAPASQMFSFADGK